MKITILLLAPAIQFAAAANLVVTSAVDGDPGSLRTLLASAQSGDRVAFDAALSGKTLLLTLGGLRVDSKSITLDGSELEEAITISGASATNLFTVGSQASLDIDTIVLSGGSSQSGGAINCSGSMALRRCTFKGNRATNGGAVFHSGSFGTNLLIENCTFDGNSAQSRGGALYLSAWGSVELSSCTVTGNSSVNQGGGIYSSYQFTCRNSVLAGNTAGSAPADVNSGTLTPSAPTSGNLIGGDPLLAPLGDYGGGIPTRPPVAGSPVIDPAANPTISSLSTDQRGSVRISGSRLDSGAVEHNTTQTFVLPADGTAGAGLGKQPAVWSIEADADTFEIYLGTTSGALELVGTTSIGSYELPLTESETTYYWRIDALRAGTRTTGAERSISTRALLTVTTLADEDDGTPDPGIGGGTSLREAVLAANAAPGGDRIEFAPTLGGGTITLESGQIQIFGTLHIDASHLANELTISGNHISSIFKTSPEGSVAPRVELQRLRLTEAKNGAITSTGLLILRDCRMIGNLGGISAITAEKLELHRTSILANRTDTSSKGTVFSTDLVAFDSTIAANTSPTNSYAIAVLNSGDLSNVTIADNVGLGLVKNGSGALRMRQVTLTGNRGTFTSGLRINSGSVSLENCVIAGNRTESSSSNPDLQGTIASQQGFNFIGGDPILAPLGDYGGSTPTRPPAIGSPLIDPMGGSTESELPTDQRGFPRVISGFVDAGAVEFGGGPVAAPVDGATEISAYRTSLYWASNPGADSYEVFIGTNAGSVVSVGTSVGGLWTVEVLEPETTYFWRVDSKIDGATTTGVVHSFTTRPALEVTTASDENDGTADPSIGTGTSLREAVAASMETIGTDVIRFAEALDGRTIMLGGTPIDLVNGVHIDALELPSGLIVSANRLSGTFHIPRFSEARIQGITIRDGARVGTTSGYGVNNEGSLSLSRCIVTGNNDSGLYSTGSLVMQDCLVHRNRGTFNAGGLYLAGESYLRRTTIAGNRGNTYGGIRNLDFPLVLEQCTISGNHSESSSAALSSNSGDVILRQCTIAENSSHSGSSVTVGVSFATLTLEGSIIVGPKLDTNTISASDRVELGSNLTSGNPHLLPLGFYGGATPTMPPVNGSPAIDPVGGSISSEFGTDQRGRPRVVGSALDLGAVEFRNDAATFPADVESAVPSYLLPLSWSSTPGATSYEIFLGSDSTTLDSMGTTDNGIWTVENPDPETTYFWRVDATTDTGTVQGTVHSFTTRPAMLVTTVSDEDDTPSDNGSGVSLREALLRTGEAVGGDTIRFDPAIDGTILSLGGTALQVDGDVAIDASNLTHGMAISGAFRSTVLEVPVGTHALLVACTVRDGNFNPSSGTSSGSGIRNFGQLKIYRSSVVSNRAKTNGGGIYNDGTLEITNSTIAGNRADFSGGGVYNEGSLTVIDSTISGNFSPIDGAGISDDFGENSIANSIIAGNLGSTDFDGTIDSAPSPNLVGGDPKLAPLGDYGGLTHTKPPLHGSPAIDPVGGASTSSFNIDQRGQARVFNGTIDIGAVEWNPNPFRAPAEGLTGVSPLHIDLVSNGTAESYEIFIGSTPGFLVSVGHSETGTYRFASLIPETTYYWRIDGTTAGVATQGSVSSFTTRPAWIVTTAEDEDDGTADPEFGTGTSLREALNAGRNLPGGDLLIFAPALSGATLSLGGTALEIDDDIDIDASDLTKAPVVSAGGDSRAVEIKPLSNVTLKGFSIVEGRLYSRGAIEAKDCSLSLQGMTLSNNMGGAVMATRSNVTVHSSTVSTNESDFGGGLYVIGGSLNVTRSTIAGNNAVLYGGGIYATNCDINLLHATVSENSSNHSGGVYFVGGSRSENYEASIIAGNRAPNYPDLGGSPLGVPINCLIGIDPKLAPLGDYGGPTPTRPPYPGSAAIDGAVGSVSVSDQRGFPISGTADIGSAEYQEGADIIRFWNFDPDGDGTPFGVEQALGTDNFSPNSGNERNPVLKRDASGKPLFTVGRSNNALPGTVWCITRSANLAEGSFSEIFRFDGSVTFPPSNNEKISFSVGADSISVTDLAPLPGKAFYRFEAIPPNWDD